MGLAGQTSPICTSEVMYNVLCTQESLAFTLVYYPINIILCDGHNIDNKTIILTKLYTYT